MGSLNDEADADRSYTAYHEAGHAIAAATCGREVIAVYSVFPGGYTTYSGTDSKFVIYAGPWASAHLSCPDGSDDAFTARWIEQFKFNTHDWAADLRLRGYQFADWIEQNKLDTDNLENQRDEGHQFTDLDLDSIVENGRPLPPLPTPEPGWHSIMKKLWPAIEELAQDILAEKPTIHIGRPLDLVEGTTRLWDSTQRSIRSAAPHNGQTTRQL
ncbi:hypothetical protein [Mycobacteroides chelonae]|uniref:hypothetical protein n=1 Tax=Mycobacteroides chelonae TaxID=1774 RepID=UPI003AABBDD1